MTNLERLRQMPPDSFAAFINEVRSGTLMEYVDWGAWLLHEKEDFCYIGEDGICLPTEEEMQQNKQPYPCRILSDAVIRGRPYKKVIADGKLYYYPASRIAKKNAGAQKQISAFRGSDPSDHSEERRDPS